MHSISLSSKTFEEAKNTFIDKYKPDNLVRNQVQSLQFQWRNVEVPLDENYESTSYGDWEKQICGILNITNELSVVKIYANCAWCEESGTHREMKFSLHANAILKITEESFNENHYCKFNRNRTESRMKEKVQTKMKTRLTSDPYVKKMLLGNDQSKVMLLEGHVKFDLNQFKTWSEITQLEERVVTISDALKGLRLLQFSLMETNIDLAEFLLHLPYLPREQHIESKKASICLGERVAMRLLEDVMIDECEHEGEDDLLDDLQIAEDGEHCSASENKIKKIKMDK